MMEETLGIMGYERLRRGQRVSWKSMGPEGIPPLSPSWDQMGTTHTHTHTHINIFDLHPAVHLFPTLRSQGAAAVLGDRDYNPRPACVSGR